MSTLPLISTYQDSNRLIIVVLIPFYCFAGMLRLQRHYVWSRRWQWEKLALSLATKLRVSIKTENSRCNLEYLVKTLTRAGKCVLCNFPLLGLSSQSDLLHVCWCPESWDYLQRNLQKMTLILMESSALSDDFLFTSDNAQVSGCLSLASSLRGLLKCRSCNMIWTSDILM